MARARRHDLIVAGFFPPGRAGARYRRGMAIVAAYLCWVIASIAIVVAGGAWYTHPHGGAGAVSAVALAVAAAALAAAWALYRRASR